MNVARPLALLILLMMPATLRAESGVRLYPVGKEEAAKWLRTVIPLPHEIVIDRKAILDARQVQVDVAPGAGFLEHRAAAELTDLIARKSGVKQPSQNNFAVFRGDRPSPPAPLPEGEGSRYSTANKNADDSAGAFRIVLGCCGKDGKLAGRAVPGAERLFSLPNAGQAYRIVALEERTLCLVGTRPEGVYYAAKTLGQLLDFSPASPGGQIVIPLLDATDWPDMAERGLWGGDANDDMAWMARWKLNYVQTHAKRFIGPDGRGIATIPQKLLAEARMHAVKLTPSIAHLDQLPASVFLRYPQLKAVGAPQDEEAWRELGADVHPVCFSQPIAGKILADWLICLGKYPEVKNAVVALGELEEPCRCPKCAAVNPFVLQTRVAVEAWREAKRRRPDFGLRILLTQGSYPYNDQVLAAVPRDVGIIYYHGNETYDSSRNPMIYPLLEKYAAAGGWLGINPQLTASYRVVCPWSAPQFIKARMTEYVSKGVQCLDGYATPSNRFYEFNVAAAAEWSWNVHGRSEREFAAAWATHQGSADPEKAADWAMILGPVGWDVYGWRVPYFWATRGVAYWLREGKRPRLGSSVFTYFPTLKHFDDDLVACDRAMTLARSLGSPEMIEETRVIRGLVKMLKEVYLIAEVTAVGEKASAEERAQAAEALAQLDLAGQDVRAGLLSWANAVAPRLMPPRGYAVRFADTVDCLDRVVSEASDALVALDVPDPRHRFRVHRIGEWTAGDFQTGPWTRKTWEVGNLLSAPGHYAVTFHYEGGWHAARIKRVSLVSTPRDDTSRRTQLACDVHEGMTGHREIPPEKAVYDLRLRSCDPLRRYFIIADVSSDAYNSPPDQPGTKGYVTMRLLSGR